MFAFFSRKTEEEKIKDFLSDSKKYMIDCVRDNPEIFYKGVPLAMAIYIFFPMIIFLWEWLPWITSVYFVYQRIPVSAISYFLEIYNSHKSKIGW